MLLRPTEVRRLSLSDTVLWATAADIWLTLQDARCDSWPLLCRLGPMVPGSAHRAMEGECPKTRVPPASAISDCQDADLLAAMYRESASSSILTRWSHLLCRRFPLSMLAMIIRID